MSSETQPIWHVTTDPIGMGRLFIENDKEEVLATIPKNDGKNQKTAHLIASAPQLLEVLKLILELGRKCTENDKYDGYYESARKAIARAEGRGE